MDVLNKLTNLEKQAAEFGFKWELTTQIMQQIQSEVAEIEVHLKDGDQEKLQEEIGDLLHAVFSLCVFCGFDPEETLANSVNKFERRFEAIQELATEKGLSTLNGMSFQELMMMWDKAKELTANTIHIKNNKELHQFAVSHDFLNQIIKTQSRLAEADFNLDAFMKIAVEQMQLLTPATGVVIELAEGNQMVYRAATGTVAEHIGLRLDIRGSISGLCLSKREILISNDTELDSRVNVEACRRVQARSLIVAPLIYDGNTVGVLKILSNKVNGFNEIDVQTLQIMAGVVASGLAHQLFYNEKSQILNDRTQALDRLQQAQKQLQYLASHDCLTDLPNRSVFHDSLNNAILRANRMQLIFAVMYLDIDHFKSINDTLGHDVGDEILKIFAARIKQNIRAYNVVARLGGDEFVLLIEDLHSVDDAEQIAKKIVASVNEKIILKNTDLTISTSIGITIYKGDNLNPTQIIKQADDALYIAKKAGRNRYHVFSV
jgi:diguanylate cyclase (GGDEF)-like protein